MKKSINYTVARHNVLVMKLGIAAFVALFAGQSAGTEWASVSSNIENGGSRLDFHHYNGSGKAVTVDNPSLQQYALNGNLVGQISDDNFYANQAVNGFSLHVKDLSLPAKRLIFAGGSYSGEVTQNSLQLTRVSDGYDLDVRAGHSYKGSAVGNRLVIADSTLDKAIGGSSRIGVADENQVNVSNAEVRVLHGGRTWFSKHGAKNNEVNVVGSVASWVYGGESQGGEVSGNKVTISAAGDKKSVSRGVIGGKSVTSSRANVNHNKVTIIGSEVEAGYDADSGVYGARAAYGNADNNKVSIRSEGNRQAVIQADVFGAANEGRNTFGMSPSTANGNEVSIAGAVVQGDIYVAKSAASDTNQGKLDIRGDGRFRAQVASVYGGYSVAGAASQNRLNIADAEVSGDVYGGYINDGYDKQASQNRITLSNVQIGGNVYGGYNRGTESHTVNNVITLQNRVHIDGDLAGGMAESDSFGAGGFSGFGGFGGFGNLGGNNTVNADVKSGNTLHVYSAGVRVKNVKNFAVYHFYLPADTVADSDVLTTTGNEDTDLSGSQIHVTIKNSRLKPGESVNLFKSTHAKVITDAQTQTHVTASGLLNDYEFAVQNTDSAALKATLVRKTANAHAQAMLNTAGLSSEMVDKLDDVVQDSVRHLTLNQANSAQPHFAVFVGADGFKADYDDSDTDIKGATLAVGIAAKAGEHLYGGFMENGYADYHSRKEPVAFDGKIRAYGGGAFVHLHLPYSIYFDGIVRAGISKTKNHGTDDGFNYRLSMPYYGATAGVGHQLNLGGLTLDNAVAYVYTYVGSDSADIQGQRVTFKHSRSNKLKAQSKWIYTAGAFQPFVALKFDYKFNGKSAFVAQPEDDVIARHGKGGNVGADVGFRYFFTPAAQLNLSVGRMTGKREESHGKLAFVYLF